jgi:hypothetical protein
MRRLRTAPKAPAAVAGILAMPLFFVGLMAMSLAVEKPSVGHVLRHGKTVTVLGDPTGTTEAKIWLLAAAPPLALALLGVVASMLLGRAGVVVTALGAIALSVALLVPLGGWASGHADRYPVGVDLIPRSAGSQDIYLRGEWEANAKRTAEQLGLATMSIAGVAILVFGLLEFRRRRGLLRPLPPPPPATAMSGVPPGSQ